MSNDALVCANCDDICSREACSHVRCQHCRRRLCEPCAQLARCIYCLHRVDSAANQCRSDVTCRCRRVDHCTYLCERCVHNDVTSRAADRLLTVHGVSWLTLCLAMERELRSEWHSVSQATPPRAADAASPELQEGDVVVNSEEDDEEEEAEAEEESASAHTSDYDDEEEEEEEEASDSKPSGGSPAKRVCVAPCNSPIPVLPAREDDGSSTPDHSLP